MLWCTISLLYCRSRKLALKTTGTCCVARYKPTIFGVPDWSVLVAPSPFLLACNMKLVYCCACLTAACTPAAQPQHPIALLLVLLPVGYAYVLTTCRRQCIRLFLTPLQMYFRIMLGPCCTRVLFLGSAFVHSRCTTAARKRIGCRRCNSKATSTACYQDVHQYLAARKVP